jgi:lysozyme
MTTLFHEAEHAVEDVFTTSAKLTMRDISAWNGIPDIPSLGAAIIASKATEGTGYKSPVFQRDWLNTKAAGKGRIAYHFFHPSISAIAQARFFLDTVKNAGLEAGDCLALDLEQSDGLDSLQVSKTAQQLRDFVQNEVKCSLIIYTYLNFAETGNCAGLGNQPLWIADPSSPEGHPRVPLPWTLWSFHQYGVTKGIDDDVCNFTSMETFYKFAVLPEPPPLAPNQRLIHLTDGTVSKDTLVNIENLVAGYKMTAGTAEFAVLEDGLPKSVT